MLGLPGRASRFRKTSSKQPWVASTDSNVCQVGSLVISGQHIPRWPQAATAELKFIHPGVSMSPLLDLVTSWCTNPCHLTTPTGSSAAQAIQAGGLRATGCCVMGCAVRVSRGARGEGHTMMKPSKHAFLRLCCHCWRHVSVLQSLCCG